MKKIIAMLLALCLMAVTLPALAETTGEGGLGSLLNLAGSFLGDSDEDDVDLNSLVDALDNSEGEDVSTRVSSMMGLLDSLGLSGEGSVKPSFTAVAAESADQFYGSWTVARVAIGEMEFPMEMLALLGIEASGEITLSENHVIAAATYSSDSGEEPVSKQVDLDVETVLADGALNVTLEGETVVFQLTDAGELACVVRDAIAVYFTPAA